MAFGLNSRDRLCHEVSTKQSLLTAVDDIEIIALELFDLLANQNKLNSKTAAVEQTNALIQLLVAKDKEIQELLKVAKTQEKVQVTVDKLQKELDKQQDDIVKLQTHLKEAESLLANAVFQAKQKLEHIHKANKNPVSSEELIKYAHKISASNSVSCPPGWTPGDQRRPYPSEMEMRMGWLGKMSDPSWNFNQHCGVGQPGQENQVIWAAGGSGTGAGSGTGMHPPHSQPVASPAKGPHRSPGSASGSGTIHYQPPQPHAHGGSQDVLANQHRGGGAPTPLSESALHLFSQQTGHPSQKDDDVEVMSTDSSSSSSSDSQ